MSVDCCRSSYSLIAAYKRNKVLISLSLFVNASTIFISTSPTRREPFNRLEPVVSFFSELGFAAENKKLA